jgi:hypothetical protein
MMCDNYRAAYKILVNVLYINLVPDAEEIIGEYQGGLRREDQLLITLLL